MKLFFKSLCVALALTIIFSMIPFSAQCRNISGEVFRLHILANSDSEEDQSLKLKVRNRVLEYTEDMYKNCESLAQAEELTLKNLNNITELAQQTVLDNGYSYLVKAEIKKMYFDTRRYERVTMPSGMYDALRITIGSGRGHNWWCVMYPSLCVGASTDYSQLKNNTSDGEYRILTDGGYEYKFKIVEYFEKIRAFFS